MLKFLPKKAVEKFTSATLRTSLSVGKLITTPQQEALPRRAYHIAAVVPKVVAVGNLDGVGFFASKCSGRMYNLRGGFLVRSFPFKSRKRIRAWPIMRPNVPSAPFKPPNC